MTRPPTPRDGRRSQRAGSRDSGELRPIGKAPSLFTLNGFGFKLYGKSDYEPATESFMTTHYVVALFVPLFPIARYRVVSADGWSYRFLGQGRLRTIDKFHAALFAGLVIYAIKTAGLK